MHRHVCIHMCRHVYRHVLDMCIGMCIDTCIAMCVDMWIAMCVDMCVDMCIDTCADMCTDMCADMCVGASVFHREGRHQQRRRSVAHTTITGSPHHYSRQPTPLLQLGVIAKPRARHRPSALNLDPRHYTLNSQTLSPKPLNP